MLVIVLGLLDPFLLPRDNIHIRNRGNRVWTITISLSQGLQPAYFLFDSIIKQGNSYWYPMLLGLLML